MRRSVLLFALALCATLTEASYSEDGPSRLQSFVEEAIHRCDQNEGDFCLFAGKLYADGTGVTRSRSKSLELYIRGCEHGNGKACYIAGNKYLAGRWVPTNDNMARTYFEKGCNLQYGLACSLLAYLHESASTSEEMLNKARVLYEKGTAFGSGGSHLMLADFILRHKIESRYDEVVPLYGKACDLDNAQGCQKLADHYETGFLVRPNAQEAQKLYRKACDMDVDEACGRIH